MPLTSARLARRCLRSLTLAWPLAAATFLPAAARAEESADERSAEELAANEQVAEIIRAGVNPLRPGPSAGRESRG